MNVFGDIDWQPLLWFYEGSTPCEEYLSTKPHYTLQERTVILQDRGRLHAKELRKALRKLKRDGWNQKRQERSNTSHRSDPVANGAGPDKAFPMAGGNPTYLTEASSPTNLQSLPFDIIFEINKILPALDLGSLRRTCKRLANTSSYELVRRVGPEIWNDRVMMPEVRRYLSRVAITRDLLYRVTAFSVAVAQDEARPIDAYLQTIQLPSLVELRMIGVTMHGVAPLSGFIDRHRATLGGITLIRHYIYTARPIQPHELVYTDRLLLAKVSDADLPTAREDLAAFSERDEEPWHVERIRGLPSMIVNDCRWGFSIRTMGLSQSFDVELGVTVKATSDGGLGLFFEPSRRDRERILRQFGML